MKYVIDIDGTLCSKNEINYSMAVPFTDRIKKINELYDQGNHITLFTARGMNTYNGNIKEVYLHYYDFTIDQLKKWEVKYHILIMGKPSGDFYIDDKGINADEFFTNLQ